KTQRCGGEADRNQKVLEQYMGTRTVLVSHCRMRRLGGRGYDEAAHGREGARLNEPRATPSGLVEVRPPRKASAPSLKSAVDDKLQGVRDVDPRSEEHTSELQSLRHLVCRL